MLWIELEDEFERRLEIPGHVDIPRHARVRCHLCGDPQVVFSHRVERWEHGRARVRIEILIQAILRVVAFDERGCAVAEFVAGWHRRVDAKVKLPPFAALFLHHVCVECRDCCFHPGGWLFGRPEVACSVCVEALVGAVPEIPAVVCI